MRMPCRFAVRAAVTMGSRTLKGHSGQDVVAHTPGIRGSNAITVRLLLGPIVDVPRHTRLGLKLGEQAGGHDRGEPVNPGPLGRRGFSLGSITLLRLDGFDPRTARS